MKLIYVFLNPVMLLSFFIANGQTAQRTPNIIFILADDLGWKDLSCTGSSYYETPNIDRIAAEGTNFTQAYSASRVCSPSRASILTGKYPVNHGITNWIGEPSGEAWREKGRHSKLLPAAYAWTLAAQEETLPEVLRSHGYFTFMAGKWHLGGEGSTPEDHGFEINIGGHEAGGPYSGGYFSPYGNPKMKDGPDGENLSMRLGTEVAHFLRDYKQDSQAKPFFVYLSFYAVHAPIQTTEANWRHFRDKAVVQADSSAGFAIDRILPARQRQDNPVYAGLVKQMDDAVGLVLAQLEASGLADNTIVIFTSDNGGVSSGDDYATSNRPLRGGKGQQWEGGTRVPLLVKHPSIRNEGVKNDLPVSGVDLYPTLLDMANVPVPKQQKIDGISIFPLLQGKSIEDRTLYWHYPHYGNQGGEPSSIIREGDWKLIHYYEDGRNELYNLTLDGAESEPLNSQYPRQVRSLRQKLFQWLRQTKANMPAVDPQHDPEKEHAYKTRIQQTKMRQLEDLRRDMLKPDYKPNEDWWGSENVEHTMSQDLFIYQNPITLGIDRAGIRDCFIFKDEDVYYMTGTSAPFGLDDKDKDKPHPGVPLYKSTDLIRWQFVKTIVPRPDSTQWYFQNFWAPEIHKINGKYYCTFNCRNTGQGYQWQHIGYAVSDKVDGPYEVITVKKPLCRGNDLTLFQDDDQKVYAFWNDVAADGTSWIGGAEIDLARGQFLSDIFHAITPGEAEFERDSNGKIKTYDRHGRTWQEIKAFKEWDSRGIEGAYVIKREGIYYLFYSSWTRGYEIGYATAKHIKGPWKKADNNPIYGAIDPKIAKERGFEGVADSLNPFIAVGHNAVFTGPDGKLWLSCHGINSYFNAPYLVIDPIDFDAEGHIRKTEPTFLPQAVNTTSIFSNE